MATNLIPFDLNAPASITKANIPAHILAAQAEMEATIQARNSLPQLRFKGKVWTVDLEGNQTMLTQSDGETPVSVVKVVILGSNPARSRAFYEGAFDPDKAAAPRCYSTNGQRPDESVESPVSNTCAACPNSVKGSKITDSGKQSVACASFKRVAVVPSNQLDFAPLFLRMPQTSIWDGNNGENEAKGWYAYEQYLKLLAERGCTNPAQVVTNVKFDPREAYPKLLFKAEGWLPPADLNLVRGFIAEKAEEIEAIVGGKKAVTATTTAVIEKAKAIEPPRPAPVQVTAKAVQKAKPVVVAAQDEDEEAPAAPIVVKAAPKPAAKAKVIETTPAESGDASNKLASVLGGWDD